MIKKIQHYFVPLEVPRSGYLDRFRDLYKLTGTPDEIRNQVLTFLNSIEYEKREQIPGYGLCGIKPRVVHKNFEQFEVTDFLTAYGLFQDNTIRIANYFIVDVNTNVYLNREMHSKPETQKVSDGGGDSTYDDSDDEKIIYRNNSGDGINGHLLEACLASEVSVQEASENYKVISLPSTANSITSIKTKGISVDLSEESFFDSSTSKVYILSSVGAQETIVVCYSPLLSKDLYAMDSINAGEGDNIDGGLGPDGEPRIGDRPQVQDITGFDMSRVLEAVGGANIVDGAARSGRLLVPFGRWILFSIRLWIYLKIPSIIGPLAKRGNAWDSGELADTIVDYYKQTVSSALNIWGNLPDLNPGEKAMRLVLKASFKLYFAGGLTQNEDLLKVSDGLIRLSVLTFWFGAFLKQIPPPGSVQNIISPVVFPGLPLVTPPTPNMDSAQMAMEFGFMFTIHSLTIVGFTIGLVPAGPALVPIPYPFVALI